MNRFLRTAPTRQLLSAVAALLVVVAGGTAIAVAAQGRGPVPKRESLAKAIHQALVVPTVTALSARISFTNNLISTSEVQGSDPLLSGASGRLWISKSQGLRVELQGNNGDASLVVRNGSFWAYDPSQNTVFKGTLPAQGQERKASSDKAAAKKEAVPSIAMIQRDLSQAMSHLSISSAIPGDIAGRPVYTVRVSPKQSGGLLGAAQLAWDAVRGVPLRVAVYARGDKTPALAVSATNISYGPVARSVFSISAPAGAKVVDIATPSSTTSRHSAKHGQSLGKLSFALADPQQVAGLTRTSVSRFGRGALIVYGHYLGGVAVIEQPAAAVHAPTLVTPPTGDHSGLSLPTVVINGATAQELDTALGTIVRFSRAGVEYTVIGSVTPRVADAVARAL